jgi:hypothetical protein
LVCRLQLLLALASAVILRSESRGTHDHILLSQIRDSANLEGQVPVFIPPRNRLAQLYPQALGSLFVADRIEDTLHDFCIVVSMNRSSLHCSLCNLARIRGKCWLLSVFMETFVESSLTRERILASRWLVVDFRSGSTIPAFRPYEVETCRGSSNYKRDRVAHGPSTSTTISCTFRTAAA